MTFNAYTGRGSADPLTSVPSGMPKRIPRRKRQLPAPPPSAAGNVPMPNYAPPPAPARRKPPARRKK